MSFRRRDGQQLMQPLLSTSPPQQPALQVGSSGRSGSWMRGGVSPGPERGRTSAPRSRRALLQGGPAQAPRQRDKWIPLPEDAEEEGGDPSTAAAAAADQAPSSLDGADSLGTTPPGGASYTSLTITPGLFEDLPPPLPPAVSSKRGRITLYAVADAFDRKKLEALLRSSFPASAIRSYPDAFYVEYFSPLEDTPGGDVYFFDYGVVACWGLAADQERVLVASLAGQAGCDVFSREAMEVDQFEFNYSASEKPHIQNDTVTLHRRAARDVQVKLTISYALAQSTKLSLHEKRVMQMVLDTKHLPEALAATGKVHLSSGQIARLIGRVFIEKSAVNLLSSVLDTPEYFWRAPDAHQALYERITEYLELEERVEVLNARFGVLHEMLDLLRDNEANHHATKLEWIVIVLILVETLVGIFELLGLFGIMHD